MKPVAANASVTLEKLLETLKDIDDDRYIKNYINQIIAKLRRMNLSGDLNSQRNQIISDIKNFNPQDSKKYLLENIELFKILQNSCGSNKLIVISNHGDELISHTRDYGNAEKPQDYIETICKAIDKLKSAHNFSQQQLDWIDGIKFYLFNVYPPITVNTFDEDSRFKSNGGFNRLNKVFNGELANIIKELNNYIYDDGGAA